MSLYEAQQAFACCTPDNYAYMTKRKEAQEPVLRISLVKVKPRVYVEPDNTMRRNWNE